MNKCRQKYVYVRKVWIGLKYNRGTFQIVTKRSQSNELGEFS